MQIQTSRAVVGITGTVGSRPAVVRTPSGSAEWCAGARCHGGNAEVFFPPPHFERREEKAAREGAARALCRACPVRPDCLEHALRYGETHGIWGGHNELERRRLQRQRAAARSA